jgi:transposase
MKNTTESRKTPALRIVHAHAAGIDIGSREHYVAIDTAQGPEVRTFGCTTHEIFAIGHWLLENGVRSVAMESTGVYWIPVARVLEEEFRLEVLLVDPTHVRCVPGRKTDVQDCQWLQQLHAYGLLRGVFRAPVEIEPLKAYFRHRKTIVETSAQQIQRMQKALEVMNVQLHKVLSDIAGISGMKIIRAIVAGERDAMVLAGMRHKSVKSPEEAIAKALGGTFLPEQVFVLTQALTHFDFLHQQLKACDDAIAAYMATLQTRTPQAETPREASESPKGSRARRKNQPHFDVAGELVRIAGVDLTKIPGIDTLTAQTVLSEVGVHVAAFPSEKHFASWLALCPNHAITGGRIRKRRSRPNASRLATAFRIAAQTLHKSQTALGAFYRRMRAKVGAPKAITAAARKLATIVYRMLKFGEAFVEQGQQAYENKYQERKLAALHKSAQLLGYQLLPQSVS